ncbi:serine hydrolase domain-containing protein [Pedococcus sp. 2YAF34]|uniref:serine hydrolase domain-containing protein n=1 Tax=Pedococcus sp. 2YAF34 TaxID=3233032 RepID=UPI003F9DF000
MAVLALAMPGCDQHRRSGQATSSISASARVAAAVEADFSRYVGDNEISAIVVTVDGRPLFERYYDTTAEESRSVFGITSCVMGTLIGQAIGEGRLHLEDRLSDLLPKYATQMTPRVAGVTLRQLLTMTGGFPITNDVSAYAQMVRSKDWIRFILAHQDGVPGKEFIYSDFAAHLLSPILEQATGQRVLEYARSHLFDPLGIPSRPAVQPVATGRYVGEFNRARFAWPTDPQGFTLGFTHLKITPRDMAKLGQLYLQQGQWRGKQIVPAEWIHQATMVQGSAAPTGYGYLWSVRLTDGTPAFDAKALGGQMIQVIPQRRLVVVISSRVDLTTYTSDLSAGDLQRLAVTIFRAVGTSTRSARPLPTTR